MSAAVSLTTALGATFLTRDSSLRPLLAVSLTVTVLGSAPTFWRRRRPVTLILTIIAAIWVYAFIYLVHGNQMADNMGVHGAHNTGFSANRLTGIWIGFGVLLAAQVFGLLQARRHCPASG